MDIKNLEQQLADALNQEEIKDQHHEKEAVKHLSHRYEMRQTTQFDPIVEETKIIRSMAKEVDDRYDKYMSRVRNDKKD
jgi:hypothetical protein